MKKRKLNLDNLNVESFVTSLDSDKGLTIQGGTDTGLSVTEYALSKAAPGTICNGVVSALAGGVGQCIVELAKSAVLGGGGCLVLGYVGEAIHYGMKSAMQSNCAGLCASKLPGDCHQGASQGQLGTACKSFPTAYPC